jgi:Domain of unknown function (DUF4868)
VTNKSSFMTLFKYHASIRTKGTQAAHQVVNQIPMTNSAEFVADCTNDLRALAKLTNIHQSQHFNTMNIETIQRLKDDGYPINLDFETVDGSQKLIYTKEKMWGFLKVMDDDFVKSAINDKKYEALAKRSV